MKVCRGHIQFDDTDLFGYVLIGLCQDLGEGAVLGYRQSGIFCLPNGRTLWCFSPKTYMSIPFDKLEEVFEWEPVQSNIDLLKIEDVLK